MSRAKDLTGKRFRRLVVISRNYEKQKELYDTKGVHKAFWNCRCDCGNNTIVTSSNLNNKKNPTTSCGCYAEEAQHKQKNTKENEWILNEKEGYATGITCNGQKFLIDIDDLGKVKNYCWRIERNDYVIANSRNGTNKIIWLHRLIMNATNENVYVDHKNWNKRDNRKCNLRLATKSENNINIKRKKNNTSGYTGVCLNKRNNKYAARISKNGVRTFLGSFDSFEEAVIARHEAEIKIHEDWSGEINRNDFKSVIKDFSDTPDMEEEQGELL